MTVKIGSKYEETKAMLRKRISDGTISALEAEAISHGCYFCSKQIKEKMIILLDKDNNTLFKYFLDKTCYRRAQLFFYYDNIPFSLN